MPQNVNLGIRNFNHGGDNSHTSLTFGGTRLYHVRVGGTDAWTPQYSFVFPLKQGGLWSLRIHVGGRCSSSNPQIWIEGIFFPEYEQPIYLTSSGTTSETYGTALSNSNRISMTGGSGVRYEIQGTLMLARKPDFVQEGI